jgi:putative transposase
MPRYRRQFAGTTYFFTVVAYQRRSIFCSPVFRNALHDAIHTVRSTRPFVVDAWALPDGDQDYSTRWSEIKRYVTSACRDRLHDPRLLTRAARQRNESTIWQRRFWEHQIRDEFDMEKHVDYIHFNPVRHGQVRQVGEWPYSTFHRYVRDGIYSGDWAGAPDIADLDLE